MNVREMHSRKPQLYRDRISEEFRASKRLILVTSDVSARGMDYPDVTSVVQVLIKPKMILSILFCMHVDLLAFGLCISRKHALIII